MAVNADCSQQYSFRNFAPSSGGVSKPHARIAAAPTLLEKHFFCLVLRHSPLGQGWMTTRQNEKARLPNQSKRRDPTAWTSNIMHLRTTRTNGTSNALLWRRECGMLFLLHTSEKVLWIVWLAYQCCRNKTFQCWLHAHAPNCAHVLQRRWC